MLFKPVTRDHSGTMPQSWQSLKDGDWLLEQEACRLSLWWPRFYGYYLVKLGPLAGAFDTSAARVQRHWQLGGAGQVLYAGPELPLQERSVDVLVLSHNLEYSSDPHQLMREAQRVLVDGGHLVLTGFNPLSLLNLCGFWKKTPPFDGRFYHPLRIKDWLALLGFEILSDERLLFGPSLSKSPQWLEAMGENYAHFLGAVYVLVARKRSLPAIASPALNRRKVRVVSPIAGPVTGRVARQGSSGAKG
ncbi:methyltransferase domain-containing protein [Gallaecimonas kandeliae]|uniref:class I SAM-dependent methyltransferase n=1 Tax=Gallaecimonas kandeliae TaxID=3029055 RepID=UPI0026485036|nr:methyltransferase domain-containing protein [Gallaecimonas kandeliae]WKE64233.1 methyltransferase domain-containing protein [Gallaecimonas kandeliae]